MVTNAALYTAKQVLRQKTYFVREWPDKTDNQARQTDEIATFKQHYNITVYVMYVLSV